MGRLLPRYGLVLFLLWLVASGQNLAAENPSAHLLSWLLQEKMAGVPVDKLADRLLRVEALYSDGASHAAAAIAGSWLVAGLPADAPTALSDNLRYLLAASLAREHAVPTARAILLELLQCRPPSPFRKLAFRKLVDLTLSEEDYEGTLRSLGNFSPEEDQLDELAYLKGRALAWLGHSEQARQALGSVGPFSRFRAAALYLLGVMDLEEGKPGAEDFFCQLVRQPQQGKFTFMLSRHSDEITRRAWLALARLRHDRGEFRRALDAYLQVSGDPKLGKEARWEAAWTLYRMERYRECLELLDKLDIDPRSPWYARGLLLRGYALIGLCEFEEAEKAFDVALAYLEGFGNHPPDGEELQAIAEFYPPPERPTRAEMVFDLSTDNFRRILYLQSMVWRFLSGYWFRWTSPPEEELTTSLEMNLFRARGILRRLQTIKNRIVDSAAREELNQLLSQALSAYRQAENELLRIYAHRLVGWPAARENPARLPGGYLKVEQQGLLELAQQLWHSWLQSRSAATMVRRQRAWEAFTSARQQVRLAELGKVDAQMGRKQALEVEIQNLALGHYPISIYRQLSAVGMLGPDTEYWPYDGEVWPDELESK